jgi:ribosome-binding factor A
LHRGSIKGYAESLDAELRQRISIVSADVSPDLRQARISVSIRAAVVPKKKQTVGDDVVLMEQDDEDDDNNSNDDDSTAESATTTTSTSFVSNNPAVDKRRAYSWLVRNNKALRHSLAQRMSHIKTCPQLSFVQIDVGAAVDVMQLIDQVTAGNKKRETIAVMDGDDDDDEFAGDDWIDDNDDFF